MKTREVARKYATALYLSTKDKDIVTEIFEQLSEIKKIAQHDNNFLDFLKSPQVPESDKKEFVAKVFGSRVHPMIVQLFVVLIEKNRFEHFLEIIDEFDRKVEADRGIGRATVISAKELTEAEKQKLTEKLSKKMNLKIQIETEVDPNMIGGVIVLTHNQIIDGSIRYGLDMIEQSLQKVRVA
ncbi:MAG: ATP synthase F1 subunit delta [candidate division Zixibacteria bacterium]|nr:ATP synthase F1 subunit delta [candidate division Zixibacteria bacterium]